MPKKLPREFAKRIESVKNKRARLVLDRIAQRGSITTEELTALGYNHPPRARQDAIDLGFPIKATMVKSSAGKQIAQYSFDLSRPLGSNRGRSAIPKKKRDELIAAVGSKCQLCGAMHDLQVDHRVPFQVAGESRSAEADAYMVLDGSCNRRKSWACEHCPNFIELKEVGVCLGCYWANPARHEHVAMQQMRRMDLTWTDDETSEFDAFRNSCLHTGTDPHQELKRLLISRK